MAVPSSGALTLLGIAQERYYSTLEKVVRRQVSPWQAVKYLLDGDEA